MIRCLFQYFAFLICMLSITGKGLTNSYNGLPSYSVANSDIDTIPKQVNPKSNTRTNNAQRSLEHQYCSNVRQTKYRVAVNGSKVVITSVYKDNKTKVTGTMKNGKIYSNDPFEKENKAYAGKYYVLKGKTFRVLNFENGDYEDFILCE
jgi:hypothetical protein